MSDYEHYKGTITPVDDIGITAEESAKRILGDKWDPEEGDWQYQLYDHYYKEYVAHNDRLYKVEAIEMDPYDDIMEADDNGDGTYSFHVKYYNGGCGMCEAIEESLQKLDA